MRILLLAVNSESAFSGPVVPPFGLMSLGTFVQGDGHDILGLDMNGPSDVVQRRYLNEDPDLLDRIRDFSPDLVAMSTYAPNIHNVLFWSELIKRECPGCVVVVGGNHASYIGPEIIRACPAVDIVIRFEGELPFKHLCDTLARGSRGFTDVPGAVFRHGNDVVETATVPLIEDLGLLPSLNRGMFQWAGTATWTHTDVISARGCRFHCTFCNCNHYWGKRHRSVPVARTVEELQSLKVLMPRLRSVRFRDEAISGSRTYCRELCDALVQADLGLEFHAHARLDGLDDELIGCLAAAGFREVRIGLESGSQAVLNRLKKGIKLKNVYSRVAALRKHGIRFTLLLMSSTPGETLEEAGETLRLLRDLDVDVDEFYFGTELLIYPGTGDCRAFLEKYPDYQWLRPQELSDGYHQLPDCRGNPVGVSFFGAHYDWPTLVREINVQLGAKFRQNGETDYLKAVTAKNTVNELAMRFGTLDDARRLVAGSLAALDRVGRPWGVDGDGIFCRELFAPVLAEGRFAHYGGRCAVQEEANSREVTVQGAPGRVEYLVLPYTDFDGRSNAVANHLFDRRCFEGTLVKPSQLLAAPDAQETLERGSPTEIVKRMTFLPKYRPTTPEGRLAVPACVGSP